MKHLRKRPALIKSPSKMLHIKKKMLEPCRLISSFSPKNSYSSKMTMAAKHKSEKMLPRIRIPSFDSRVQKHPFIELPPSVDKFNLPYTQTIVAEQIPKVFRRIKMDSQSGNILNRHKGHSYSSAIIVVTKNPFGEHRASAGKDVLHIMRKSDITFMVSRDRLERMKCPVS